MHGHVYFERNAELMFLSRHEQLLQQVISNSTRQSDLTLSVMQSSGADIPAIDLARRQFDAELLQKRTKLANVNTCFDNVLSSLWDGRCVLPPVLCWSLLEQILKMEQYRRIHVTNECSGVLVTAVRSYVPMQMETTEHLADCMMDLGTSSTRETKRKRNVGSLLKHEMQMKSNVPVHCYFLASIDMDKTSLLKPAEGTAEYCRIQDAIFCFPLGFGGRGLDCQATDFDDSVFFVEMRAETLHLQNMKRKLKIFEETFTIAFKMLDPTQACNKRLQDFYYRASNKLCTVDALAINWTERGQSANVDVDTLFCTQDGVQNDNETEISTNLIRIQNKRCNFCF